MISDTTFVTYILLAAAICAAWAKPVGLGRVVFAPWVAFFVGALAFGMAAGVLRAPAIVALAALAGTACMTARAPRQRQYLRVICGAVTAVLALALAVHKLPGFNNAIVIDAVTISPGAAPYTQYANFDKGAVGLILLAFLCSRARSWNEFGGVLKQCLPMLLVTLVAVLGFATAIGAVRPDFKLSQLTMQFIAVNLFFTVVAEEAFFRGFLQQRLAASLARWRSGKWIALACSALLFGLVHLPGGAPYALLATIAGFGYAYAYHVTQRIEAPIFVHIALNAAHFIAFSYPALR